MVIDTMKNKHTYITYKLFSNKLLDHLPVSFTLTPVQRYNRGLPWWIHGSVNLPKEKYAGKGTDPLPETHSKST